MRWIQFVTKCIPAVSHLANKNVKQNRKIKNGDIEFIVGHTVEQWLLLLRHSKKVAGLIPVSWR